MTDSSPKASVLLTSADIPQWEEDLRKYDAEIQRIIELRDSTRQRLELARQFAELVPAPAAPAAAGPAQQSAPRKRRASPSSTWTESIHAIVKTAEMGLTFAELRERLMQSPIADRMAASTKGYHNALSRLAKKKKIVRQYGRVFTPAAFRRFEAALDVGDVTADAPQPFAHSPMGTAILKLVQARPGITSTLVIVELRKDTEFNASLTPHRTGAFNIIARLARRKQIVRRDDGGLIPGPQFPQELLGQTPDEVGAPNGQAASAPKAGEVTASPNENQPTLRLIG